VYTDLGSVVIVMHTLYLDENGDMPSESCLRKRGYSIRTLRKLGITPKYEIERNRKVVVELPKVLTIASQ
jgi:hypothetical protein